MSDGELRYREQGTGLPLVLLHGFPFDAACGRRNWRAWATWRACWRPTCRASAPPRRCRARPRTRGWTIMRGPSCAGSIDRRGNLHAGRAQHGRLCGPRAGPDGAFAARRADPGEFAGRARPKRRSTRHTLALAVRERGPVAAVEANLPRLLAPGDGRPEARQRTREMMLRQSPAGIVAALYAMAARPDSRSFLRRLETPTLSLARRAQRVAGNARAGTRRSAAPLETPRRWTRRCPGCVAALAHRTSAGLDPSASRYATSALRYADTAGARIARDPGARRAGSRAASRRRARRRGPGARRPAGRFRRPGSRRARRPAAIHFAAHFLDQRQRGRECGGGGSSGQGRPAATYAAPSKRCRRARRARRWAGVHRRGRVGHLHVVEVGDQRLQGLPQPVVA